MPTVTKQDLIEAMKLLDSQPIPKTVPLQVPEFIKQYAKKLGLEPKKPVADEFAYYYQVFKRHSG